MKKALIALILMTNVVHAQSRSSGAGGASSLSLSALTDAGSTDTLANAGYAQVWNWDTLGSAIGLTMATAHTSFSGNVLRLSSTGNNSSSTGSVLQVISTGTSNAATGINITSASTSASAKGLAISMTGTASAHTGISVTEASDTGFAIAASRAGTSGSSNLVTITDASTSNSTGLSITMTGATGNQGGITAVTSTTGSPVTANLQANGATNTGTALNAHNASTSGGSAIDADVAVAGAANIMRLYNKGTAANNNGAGLLFHAHRTGTNDTQIAKLSGIITDITAGAYLGALVFSTSKNATPTEHMRLDALGHIVMTGTAPAVSSCGTGSPSVAGTDVAGRITIGTGTPSSCTLTFANAYATAPSCTVGDETTSLLLKGIASTTTLVITAVAFGNGDTISYICLGY